MILKPYEIKNHIEKKNIFLFYGENFGLKEEIINNLFKMLINNLNKMPFNSDNQKFI